MGDFPGGAMDKNPPANAEDMGSSPGRSHMPWSNWAHVPQLLSLHSRARELQLLSPRATTTEAHVLQLLKPAHLEPALLNKRRYLNEKSAHHNEEQPLLATTRESLRAATRTQQSQKKKKK